MIAVENQSGELIKVFNHINDLDLGFHKLFGLVSNDSARKRMEKRKLAGVEFSQDEWLCRFSLKNQGKNLDITKLANCEFEKLKNGSLKLITSNGEFFISQMSSASIDTTSLGNHDRSDFFDKITRYILLFIMIAMPVLLYLNNQDVIEEIEAKKELKPIVVQVIKPVNTVQIQSPSKKIEVKPLTKAQKSNRAVKRNLGFLGLVGSKTLSKVNGGVPQKLAKVTAGAGKGGDAGSGGEVLTGLGKGLKKITVGNTGVAGLGGIGTKGAGGGKGGYGNTMVASGEGIGITGISVSSNDMVLDGGLSRYAINATIAKYLSQVRRCYENGLNKKPDLEGLVTVAFEIGGSGMLNYSNVHKSSLRDAGVEKCITTKMMSWKFPKPKGGVNVKVNYPFMLRPVGT